jgi:4-amino-4-deoxy-L-arabinose transferase-like glycosyltransferase
MSSDSFPYRAPPSPPPMPPAPAPAVRPPARGRLRTRVGRRARVLGLRVFAKPELIGLVGVATVLNLWGLSVNGWANTYYSAAVRSMSMSWHNFLFASMDPSGLMTVDKPPLSVWVQALSARIFGYHPLSLLIPQALMGIVAVALVYDLVRRRFGRAAGFAGGLALALTPVAVAASRHNNPDELLVLCCVAAVWFFLRALDTRRTRWLVLAGIAVGLGFETKMGVALMVVPGMTVAWIWTQWDARGGKLRSLRQLLSGGLAMALAGTLWPLLVALTPAGSRPWISGTSDNSIWSLIFGYNGLGRVAGQTGGPGGGPGFGGSGLGARAFGGPGLGGPGLGGASGGPGGGGGRGGSLFGGATGPFRLLQSGLGDQAGWLLGFALVAGLALLVLTRLRRRDPRTGWLIAVGGAFLTPAVTFSFASGIFHPYYVSLLAPFTAMLVGAGVGLMLPGRPGAAASTRSATVVAAMAIAGGAITELVVLGNLNGSLSWAVPLVIVAALLAPPATWAAETLGHATNGTFPAGGPASASGGAPGGRGGVGGFGGAVGGAGAGMGGFGGRVGGSGPGAAVGAGGAAFGAGSSTLTAAVKYAKAHGGGTLGVSSQSSAANAIVATNANVAGLGGFSGRESSVSAAWIASEVRSGHLRWVLADGQTSSRLPGDTRTGSRSALSTVERTCPAVTFTTSSGTKVTMYDCLGRASAILTAAGNAGR